MNNKVCIIAEARRSIVANTPIFRGDTFNEVNVICKRPSGGINPMQWPKLIGKVADRDYAVDDQIQWPES